MEGSRVVVLGGVDKFNGGEIQMKRFFLGSLYVKPGTSHSFPMAWPRGA